MDPRRAPRSVINPQVRQVGFFTPPPLPLRSQSVPLEPSVFPLPSSSSPPASDMSPASNSLSPVMIPPARHVSLDSAAAAAALGSRPGTATSSVPVPVPASGLRREGSGPGPTGNYELSELVPDTSSATSPSFSTFAGGSEFSEDVFGRDGMEMSAPSLSGDAGDIGIGTSAHAAAARPSPGKAPTGKLSGGASEDRKGTSNEQKSEGVSTSKLKEKTSKAERRAIQEAQRAAKAAAKESGTVSSTKQPKPVKMQAVQTSQKKETAQEKPTAFDKKDADRLSEKDRKKDIPPPRMQFDDKSRVEKAKKRSVVSQSEARNRVELFRHLPQYVHGSQLPDLESKFFDHHPIHPSVYKVGLQYLSGDITGGNARCVAMLLAFREAISDYSTPPDKLFGRDLAAKISSYISYLIECRPLCTSMGNAIRFLKTQIGKLSVTLSEAEAKSSLQSDIDRFINQKILLASKVIVEHAITKIGDGDVLLTYGYSSVIEMIFVSAYECGKHFRVVIVDSRPKLEGQKLLRRLVARGISCTYTHINALSYIMHEVSRVFVGASSVLSNGTVYSRVGTASVAMVAHAFCVPVLVCCEAYKFHSRVLLDSICSNELGDPDVVSKVLGRDDVNQLDGWADNENLQLLNLTYDATPADYVSMIVTDYGMIPPSSVPVIVREYCRGQLWMS